MSKVGIKSTLNIVFEEGGDGGEEKDEKQLKLGVVMSRTVYENQYCPPHTIIQDTPILSFQIL